MTTTLAPPRLATAIAQLWPPQGRWTETDYFSLPDTNQLVELAHGEIAIMPPPSFTHQRILDALYYLLKAFVHQHQLGITAFAPVSVRLRPGLIRQPDILFYTHAHANRIGELVSGVPDLVVEVISPGSRKVDEEDKFVEYAEAGIGEYWLVDPEAHQIKVYALGADGLYQCVAQAERDGQAHSQLLAGFAVSSTAVFG